jgi:hypothetical protein
VLSQTRPSGWMNSAVAQSSGSDPSNKTFMRVCLRAATLRTSEDVIVGPFEVSANDTVQEVEKMIQVSLNASQPATTAKSTATAGTLTCSRGIAPRATRGFLVDEHTI